MSETLPNPDRNITVPVEDALTARVDFYKPNMSQLHFEQHPNAQVTFTFKDRGDLPLAETVDPDEIADRFNSVISEGFHQSEIDYLATLENDHSPDGKLYSAAYLGYLAASKLPTVEVERTPDNRLAIATIGDAPLVTFAETAVMGELVEMYFYNIMKHRGVNLKDVYNEGDRRLSEKIELIKQNPDLKIMEFGTRRHFSVQWHMHVLERLITEVPDNILGTSNLFMADYFGIPAMGTSAHEMDMVYAALAGDDDEALYNAHPQMMDHWMERYGPRYATGLTDTFGAKYFFDSLGPERARTWGKYRQDSGDPFLFGDYALRRLREYDVDPEDKLITWSDGLDIPLSVKLLGEFRDETNPNFGIGTDLTCDLGLDALFGVKALNIVMKATHVNGRPTVKLSDVATKHTGPTDEVERYKRVFNYVPLSDAVKLG